MLKEFNLGHNEHVIKYIRQELSRGFTLARYLQVLPLESGHVMTYLPPDYTYEEAVDVERTIVVAPWPTFRIVVEELWQYIHESDTNCVVFEDSTRKPEYPFMQTQMQMWCQYENTVYHWFDSKHNDDFDMMYGAIRSIPGYPRIGVLTSLPNTDAAIKDRQTLTEEIIATLAQRTTAIVVAAYDDSANLVWHRQ